MPHILNHVMHKQHKRHAVRLIVRAFGTLGVIIAS
jgi:hypothetical protein